MLSTNADGSGMPNNNLSMLVQIEDCDHWRNPLSSQWQEILKNDNPTLFFTDILLCLVFYCFIYMLYDCRECTAKGNSLEDYLCGKLNALESPMKLR